MALQGLAGNLVVFEPVLAAHAQAPFSQLSVNCIQLSVQLSTCCLAPWTVSLEPLGRPEPAWRCCHNSLVWLWLPGSDGGGGGGNDASVRISQQGVEAEEARTWCAALQ